MVSSCSKPSPCPHADRFVLGTCRNLVFRSRRDERRSRHSRALSSHYPRRPRNAQTSPSGNLRLRHSRSRGLRASTHARRDSVHAMPNRRWNKMDFERVVRSPSRRARLAPTRTGSTRPGQRVAPSDRRPDGCGIVGQPFDLRATPAEHLHKSAWMPASAGWHDETRSSSVVVHVPPYEAHCASGSAPAVSSARAIVGALRGERCFVCSTPFAAT